MRQGYWTLACLLVLLAFPAAGCEGDQGPATAPDDGFGAPDSSAPDSIADVEESPPTFLEPGCDDSKPPLVMLHGMLASGDTYANLAMRAAGNGLCADRYHAFDWDTIALPRDDEANIAALDAFVDEVLERHEVAQVHLIGHSAGGGLSYLYLADSERAAKVSRYVHVGSFVNDGPAGPPEAPVPTLNLYSLGDLIVAGADIPGAENVALEEEDHYSVVTSAASYAAIHEFLYDTPPATTEIVAQERPVLFGKALLLGENTPLVGARVEIWRVELATGQRQNHVPEAVFETDGRGGFGPFAAEAEARYEMALYPQDETPVHYYREAFVRSNGLVYLRGLPSSGLAALLLQEVNFDDAHTVLVNFTANRAVTAGSDSLKLDGEELLTMEVAAEDDSLIALFLYDDRGDGEDGGPVAFFKSWPFLNALDRFIPADPAGSLVLELNGRKLATPRWPSESEGAVITVFE